MARQTNPLTDKEIKSLKPKEKTYRKFDGGGLHIEVSPQGQKWWRLKYRFDGKEKRISLGVYPAVSLSKARKGRELLKEQIAQGIDPSEARKITKQALIDSDTKNQRTLQSISEEYINHVEAKGKLSESHFKRQKRRIELYIHTDISALKPIEDISRVDALDLIDKLVVSGKQEIARRVLQLLKNILEYAVDREYISGNVSSGIKASKAIGERTAKHYPIITEKKQLKGLLLSLDAYEGDFSTKQALRMMPYVALRPANVRFLEWNEVDLEEKVINISADKMKMRVDHRIPLTKSVIRILEEIKPYSGDGRYVFPSAIKKGQPLSENTLNVGLRRLGYTKEQIVSHSFRGMFSTIAHKNMKTHGFESLVIEAQLAHRDSNASRKAYNHNDYFDDRVNLMDWWDEYLTGIKNAV